MSYTVAWHEEALAELKKFGDRAVARKILHSVGDALAQDPVSLGTPLKGEFKGLHRYRYWKIGVIYAINKEENQVYVLEVGGQRMA